MNDFVTKPEQSVEVYKIAAKMSEHGLSASFIADAVEMALNYEGAFDLLQLWNEESEDAERDEIIADLSEEIERTKSLPKETYNAPRIDFDDLASNAEKIMEFKQGLRQIVDRWGGISKLAKATGIPQASLSRFFSSASLPRNRTIYRIVDALLPKGKTASFSWTEPIKLEELNAVIWSRQNEQRA